MPSHSPTVSDPRSKLPANAIVAFLCMAMAVFMLFIASVCGALMRSDAAMMAVARPKICLIPKSPAKLAPARVGQSAPR